MRRIICLAALSVLSLAAIGCGGSSGGDSTGQVEFGDGGEGNPAPNTVGDVAGVSEECEALINLISVSGQIMAGQIPAESARETIDRFVEAVPTEIKAEATVFTDAYLDWVALLAKHNDDLTLTFADPEAAAVSERLADAEMSGAFERITGYVTAECNWMGQ
jgi:hypothetical protein